MISKVIAIGGGGFLMEPENMLLDRYCLEQTGKSTPKVCFIPTASGDSEDFLLRFYTAFERYSCEAEVRQCDRTIYSIDLTIFSTLQV